MTLTLMPWVPDTAAKVKILTPRNPSNLSSGYVERVAYVWTKGGELPPPRKGFAHVCFRDSHGKPCRAQIELDKVYDTLTKLKMGKV